MGAVEVNGTYYNGGGLSFVGLNNVGGDPPSAVVDAATIAARLNGP